MKKSLIATLALVSAFNVFAFSEGRELTRMSADGKPHVATLKMSAQALVLGATVSSPGFGAFIYLCMTQGGPGLSADLDFITYDEKYGLLPNAIDSAKFSSNNFGSVTDASASTTAKVNDAIVAFAKIIVGESDEYYAGRKVSPSTTPEIHRSAKQLSELSDMGLEEAADEVVYGAERVLIALDERDL